MSSSLLMITALKLLLDVALFSLIGQALMFVFAGSRRQENFVYRLFQILTKPVFAIVGAITPAFVGAQFHGLIGFFIVFWAWVATIFGKCYICVSTVGTCERGCVILMALFGMSPG